MPRKHLSPSTHKFSSPPNTPLTVKKQLPRPTLNLLLRNLRSLQTRHQIQLHALAVHRKVQRMHLLLRRVGLAALPQPERRQPAGLCLRRPEALEPLERELLVQRARRLRLLDARLLHGAERRIQQPRLQERGAYHQRDCVSSEWVEEEADCGDGWWG